MDGYTLPDNVEVLLLGTKVSVGTGNASNNYLLGNSLNNILNGAAGADVMAGYDGNDSYYIDNVGDIVWEATNQGVDTVNTYLSYILMANVENLNLLGTAVGGFGNNVDNVITGNTADNLLNGGGGANTLIGGTGNDYYFVSSTLDTIVENVGEGSDIVYSTAANFTLTANVENMVIWGTGLNGTGNAGDNIIFGGEFNNTLADGAGSDILVGGRGQDTYILSVDNTLDMLYISAGDSLVTSYDKAYSFNLGTSTSSSVGVDRLNLPTTLIAANTSAVGGTAIGSITGASINNGIISFRGIGGSVIAPAAVVLNDAIAYIQANITGTNTVAFVAGTDTFVFQDAGTADTLVDLVAVTATSINATGLGVGTVWII